MVMRSFLSCLLGMMLLLSPTVAVSAVSPLRVVLDDNYPPYSFRDDQGHLQGLREDIWRLWAEVNHRPVVLLGEHWADAQHDLLSGKADVIDTLFDTAKRRQQYQFGPAYADIPVRIYFDKTISGISDISSLKGFTLGVKKGDACIEDLAESGVTSFSSYDDYHEVIQAAGRGDIHLFCMDGPPATFLLFKAGLAGQFRYTHHFKIGHMSYAVLRGHTALLSRLASGFADIPKSRIHEINLRWLGQSTQPAGGRGTHYLRIISWALIVALAWVALLILWSRGLRLRVAQRTRELVDALGEVQQAHAAADEARENLLAVIDAIPDLLFEMDEEGRYISYRTQTHAINTWVKPEDFIGRRVNEILPAEVAQVIIDALDEAHRMGSSHGRQIGVELGGHQIWFELSVGRKHSPDNSDERYIILARDISERRAMAEELEKHRSHLEELVQGKTRQLALANSRLTQLSRIQRALSRSSQALVRAQREDSYQYDVCRIVVEECGHRMSWVGYVQDDEEQNVRPQAWAGEGLDYLDNLHITRTEGAWGSGPAGQALRSGQPVVLTDIQNDADYTPWQQAASEHGFHSSIAIPFRLDDGQQGVFSIYAGQSYAFSSEEIELLQELISDFAYGIAGLRLRQRHSATMEELAKRAEEETVAHKRSQSLADLLQLTLASMSSVILVW
ncbi:MAG: transporter substrate-binding domain-containing protein, partial [Pseudomonadales bacterium]|nr:transporter substrate-binding domain-containing protein [Pseudomonadales bacterium]